MKKLLTPVIAVTLGAMAYALAQVYTGPPNPTAGVCAYNVSPPAPINGRFYYVQCNSSGQIIIQ